MLQSDEAARKDAFGGRERRRRADQRNTARLMNALRSIANQARAARSSREHPPKNIGEERRETERANR